MVQGSALCSPVVFTKAAASVPFRRLIAAAMRTRSGRCEVGLLRLLLLLGRDWGGLERDTDLPGRRRQARCLGKSLIVWESSERAGVRKTHRPLAVAPARERLLRVRAAPPQDSIACAMANNVKGFVYCITSSLRLREELHRGAPLTP
eukprot:scaffold8106_cov403-Prasinococcus_capsulatus_cf.AAC.5